MGFGIFRKLISIKYILQNFVSLSTFDETYL